MASSHAKSHASSHTSSSEGNELEEEASKAASQESMVTASSSTPLDCRVFDFTSEHFKARDALANPRVSLSNLPLPNAKLFNNISEYANKTFKKSALAMSSSRRSQVEPIIERKFTQEQIDALVPTKKLKEPDNVLTLMTKVDGPLLLLKKSVGQTVRVLVMKMKSSHSSRRKVSWITGRLIAFDKHFNLILHNVIENLPDKSTSVSEGLFLRGDSVIAVSSKAHPL